MRRLFFFVLFIHFLIGVPAKGVAYPTFVTAEVKGQLGNQLFIIAAAVSLALDHNAIASFPQLFSNSAYNMNINYQTVLQRVNVLPIPENFIKFQYKEPQFPYSPIPFHPNMKISGYFQSEKYFINHKNEILDLFAPSEEITYYLQMQYQHILSEPLIVGVHLRSYSQEDPKGKKHPTLTREYYEPAMALFPKDALFVVFSNDMDWCKGVLEGLPRRMIFIENEPYYHDFYLLSMCHHQIISNSTFSWWSAYLNLNPDKRVVVPPIWMKGVDTKDLIPEEWLILN